MGFIKKNQILFIDGSKHSVIKSLEHPLYNSIFTNSILTSSEHLVIFKDHNSIFNYRNICVVSSIDSLVCKGIGEIGLRGVPVRISSLNPTTFTIFSDIGGGSNIQQSLTLSVEGQSLKVISDISTPYSPQTEVLVPVTNIYEKL